MGFRLKPTVSLRQYADEAYIFDAARFELYKIDSRALEFVSGKLESATLADLSADECTFVNSCLDRSLLEVETHQPGLGRAQHGFTRSHLPVHEAPLYLLIHITEKCNLRCGHCYLGEKHARCLTIEEVTKAIAEFAQMGGLTVLISGGEPLLHPQFSQINDLVGRFPLRFELLTNGTLLTNAVVDSLQFHEVQVSIDGWGRSHDELRGTGSFARSMKAIEAVCERGIACSVATMITKHNAESDDDFLSLERFCLTNSISNWSVTAPCEIGCWAEEGAVAERARSIEITSRFGYGEGQHDFGLKYACGANLLTLMYDGSAIGCVLQPEIVYGSLSEGLARSWERRNPVLVRDTECADCKYLDLCRGGCRVAARESSGSLLGKDLLQCAAVDTLMRGLSADAIERR